MKEFGCSFIPFFFSAFYFEAKSRGLKSHPAIISSALKVFIRPLFPWDKACAKSKIRAVSPEFIT